MGAELKVRAKFPRRGDLWCRLKPRHGIARGATKVNGMRGAPCEDQAFSLELVELSDPRF